MSDDSIGDRMKRYEAATRSVVPYRQPTIVRVDGKAFHSYTRGLERPFCARFADCMDSVAMAMCAQMQNAALAYVQSDEISVIMNPAKGYQTQAWFDGEVQKTVSVSASIAAAVMTGLSEHIFGKTRPAFFDSRVFVVPDAMEVSNYFLWRQQDATRNSIQMLARSLYSHTQCDKRNVSQLQEMCFAKGSNWNDLPTRWKRGRCVRREVFDLEPGVMRSRWAVDNEIPIFSQAREYITDLLRADDAEEPRP